MTRNVLVGAAIGCYQPPNVVWRTSNQIRLIRTANAVRGHINISILMCRLWTTFAKPRLVNLIRRETWQQSKGFLGFSMSSSHQTEPVNFKFFAVKLRLIINYLEPLARASTWTRLPTNWIRFRWTPVHRAVQLNSERVASSRDSRRRLLDDHNDGQFLNWEFFLFRALAD